MTVTILNGRKFLAFLLMLALYGSLLADAGFAAPFAHGPKDQSRDISRIRGQVAALRPGTLIEVRFISREKVRGRIGASDAGGFTLQEQNSSAASERRVSFTEVKSLQVVPGKRTKAALWIVAGVVVGVVVVALAILLKQRSNE